MSSDTVLEATGVKIALEFQLDARRSLRMSVISYNVSGLRELSRNSWSRILWRTFSFLFFGMH